MHKIPAIRVDIHLVSKNFAMRYTLAKAHPMKNSHRIFCHSGLLSKRPV